MPVRDKCEPQVITALKKANWEILRQPVTLQNTMGELFYADLEA